MDFTIIDYSFVVIVILSSVLGYFSGFLANLFGLLTWVIAAVVAKVGCPIIEPSFISLFGKSSPLPSVAAYVCIFVIVVVLISFFNHWWTGRVHETGGFKGVDSALGFLFGILRGIVVSAALYIALLWLMPVQSERPAYLRIGKSLPILRTSAAAVSGLLPETENFDTVKKLVEAENMDSGVAFDKLTRPSVEQKIGDSAENGYKESERKDLDKQLEQLQKLTDDFMK